MGWWTDLAEKRGPVINEGDGDGRPGEPEDRAVECRGLVLHIADGYYEGTVSWQHNPAASVSSQFVVAGPRDVAKGTPDGKLGQCVDTDDRAWTQRDGNGHWLSIECSGFSGDALSAAQIESCARILARGHQVYGYPLQIATSPSGKGIGHHSMGYESGVNWGHQFCPGERIKAQKPAILARAIQIASGTAPTGDDMALEPLQLAQINNAEQYAKALVEWSDQTEPISNVQTSTRKPNKLKAAFDALAADVAALKDRPVATVAMSAADRAAIVASLLPQLKAEIRDAVADLGEGGATQVRAGA